MYALYKKATKYVFVLKLPSAKLIGWVIEFVGYKLIFKTVYIHNVYTNFDFIKIQHVPKIVM